ncbi:hypothetical protein FA95DRAFT_884123 [Auriscalpium vulgare]|uniref:Uncharacterized protein n=1 Tax=Auriscalpium vulgare TaxID=40419 RepID=A0ACB8R9U9_9AGAM|nr:hypothetical protein FA95DRAFT_884123 [Auriscalpium vulgare]
MNIPCRNTAQINAKHCASSAIARPASLHHAIRLDQETRTPAPSIASYKLYARYSKVTPVHCSSHRSGCGSATRRIRSGCMRIAQNLPSSLTCPRIPMEAYVKIPPCRISDHDESTLVRAIRSSFPRHAHTATRVRALLRLRKLRAGTEPYGVSLSLITRA